MAHSFDVVVIGGGHAGAEAAWAAARLGASTALITFDRAAIGRMSCNPAIGGIGKGQMVREIDALGGLMALATDAAGIQFRTLNRSKGPAVQAPRAQCDRDLYAAAVQRLLDATPNLSIVEGAVSGLLTQSEIENRKSAIAAGEARIRGVRLRDGRTLPCDSVIITTGTFLRGLMHCGENRTPGGRVGEPAAETLSDDLARLGLELGRLKTGTPPRLARDSIRLDDLETQPGEIPPRPFSFLHDRIENEQVCCWITYTNEAVHEIIRANLHRAPMFCGQIASRGPRYCPSIEDKVVRFAEKSRHQIFLEPEGYTSDRIYCNGISTSLPPDVQQAVVRGIAGLQDARIVQMGYAVEYDFVPPHQVFPTLETKPVRGLYLAGQINGTSGYEEAAAQGLVAGLNAALRLAGRDPLILTRDRSYIGVMLDDLATRGLTEPYRMFTSRAEHRLSLRSDNADERLTPIGRAAGLVDDARWSRFQAKRALVAAFNDFCRTQRIDGRSLAEWMCRPDFDWRPHASAFQLANAVADAGAARAGPVTGEFSAEAIDAAVTHMRYAGYLRRQEAQVQRMASMESRSLPANFDFSRVPGMRAEARERLAAVRPVSVGQAGRVSGLTPADIALLLLHLDRPAR